MFKLEGLGISALECQGDDKVPKYLNEYSKKVSDASQLHFHKKEYRFGGQLCNGNTTPRTLPTNAPAEPRTMWVVLQNPTELRARRHYRNLLSRKCRRNLLHASFKCMETRQNTPLRVVFDASSKRKGNLSLNDVIHKGGSFVNKIHYILVSSQRSRIVLMCDIETAFTQIHLVESNKDLYRFLWLKNVNLPPTKDNLIYYRFKRLPFEITASPSILYMCLSASLNAQDTELATEIAKNLYVDNIMMTDDSVEEALEKYKASNVVRANRDEPTRIHLEL